MSVPPSPLAEIYDLAIIGGGINGSGIAADAAGRGLRVFLCDKDDLASHTSSASSKLIHGGLRYLEQYQFRLVREALAEREVLLSKAPHLIAPLRFILPHRPHLRPAWMIRLGLFLYDHLDRHRHLPASRGLRFKADSPLKPEITRGFEYSDCWVDDARLVLLNAMAAREQGGHVHTRTRCVSGHRSKGLWHLHLERRDGSRFSIRSRALVNACGPWVEQFLSQELKQSATLHMRLVQGSHLIVPRLFGGEQAYILQNSDRRIVFVLPYLQRFTLIGTTDREYHGDPQQVNISPEETEYLLAVVNAHFRKQLSTADILHSFSGVRPLYDDAAGDPASVTRDYRLAVDGTPETGLLLSVYGGKLTTYRRLAEAALQLLRPALPDMGPAWTATAPLPGGEQMQNPQQLADALLQRHDWIPPALARRWAGSYGSRLWTVLAEAKSLTDLGEHFGAQLYAREVDYLCQQEWALEVEDILWRRTKLGLLLSPAQQQRLSAYMQRHAGAEAATEPSPAQQITR
jgi:glycerol-3-phosphate dehydrogenase